MNKKDELVISIDFGTQSVRAIIFDQQGNTLAEEQYHYAPAYFSTKNGYCEQNIDYYWNHLCNITKALVKNNKELIKRVKGLSFTSFRDSAVCLDKDHKPLRPVILWCDQRVASCDKKDFSGLNYLLFNIVGMWETIALNRKRSMSNWIRENQPDIWNNTKYYWNVSTYFTYKFTGKEVDTAANYTGHYPIDMKKGKWFSKSNMKYEIFNIEVDKLPTLIKCGSIIGEITEECSKETGLPVGLKVIANGTDKGSETIGTGCITNNMASISYGTASTIEVTNKKYIEPVPFLPAYNACVDGFFNLEVQVYRGYWMITWFKENFAKEESLEAEIQKMAVEEVLNKRLLEINPGCDGLVLQPYWGPDIKRPTAKGTIVGFTDSHTRAHVYKSIIEGIAFALREALETIQKRQKRKVNQIMISGGGSRSSAICQITADIFGIPVKRIQTHETGSLGTAMVAYVGIGAFDNINDAIASMKHETDIFEPNMINHKKYNYLFNNVYVNIYPSLHKVNKALLKYNRKYVKNEVL